MCHAIHVFWQQHRAISMEAPVRNVQSQPQIPRPTAHRRLDISLDVVDSHPGEESHPYLELTLAGHGTRPVPPRYPPEVEVDGMVESDVRRMGVPPRLVVRLLQRPQGIVQGVRPLDGV